jgi:hydrogenase maturation protease
MPAEKKTLILGLGNDILTDDGIGPRLIKDLSGMILKDNVHFNVACCGGLEIMEYIKGYQQVVFIDAIRTKGGIPGDVYYFKPSDFRETSHLSSLHDITFITALNLGNTLDLDLPSDLHIIAVEIIEDMEFSNEFTSALRERYPEILKEVYEIINRIKD